MGIAALYPIVPEAHPSRDRVDGFMSKRALVAPGVALAGSAASVLSWHLIRLPVERSLLGDGAEVLAAARWLAGGRLPPEPVDALAHPLLTLVGTVVGAAGPEAVGSAAGILSLMLSAWAFWSISSAREGDRESAAVALLVVGAVGGATGAAVSADPMFIGLAATLAAYAAHLQGRRGLAVALGLGAGVVAWPVWAGMLSGRCLPTHKGLVVAVVGVVLVSAVASGLPGPGLAVVLAGAALAGGLAWRSEEVDTMLLAAAGVGGLAAAVMGDGVELSIALLAAAGLSGAAAGWGWTGTAVALTVGGAVATMAATTVLPIDLWRTRGALEAMSAQLEAGQSAAVVRFSTEAPRRGPLELRGRTVGLDDVVLVLAHNPTGELEGLHGDPAPAWAWVGWEDDQAAVALAWIQDHANLEGAVTWTSDHGRGGVVLPLGAHTH